jgi:hypothetical protein
MFNRLWGMSKEEMPNCCTADYYDTNYFPKASEKGYKPPVYNAEKDTNTRASAVVVVGRTAIPVCAGHANMVKSRLYRSLAKLQNLRPTLNDGESPQIQRVFNKWTRTRRERAIAKRDKVNAIYRSNEIARNQAEGNTTPPDDQEEFHYVGQEAATTQPNFDVSELLKQHGGWDKESTEEEEPEIGISDFEY